MLDWLRCGRFKYWMQDHLEDAIKPCMILTNQYTFYIIPKAIPRSPCLTECTSGQPQIVVSNSQ